VDTYPPIISDNTYAVSLPQSFGKVIPVSSPLATDDLARYISKSVVLHAGLPIYFGAWIDEGQCYLDHSMCTDDLHVANYIGYRGKQQAIWHFKSQSAIPCQF